jgi:DNA-binding beta-propeller fold protein YncE
MAERVLKQLEEQLNCSICLDTYTDPKLLQCFHVYCRKCLVPLVNRDQQGKLGLPCPNCRQTTPNPDRGVAGLRPAFHINCLLEIKDSLQQHENSKPTDGKWASHCLIHEGKVLELYCETCRELICSKCALRGGSHHDHEYEELDQAFEKYKVEIMSSSPDPSQCKVNTRVATLGEKCTATLELVNFKGEPCKKIIEGLGCELLSEISSTRTRCSVERRGQSQYEISYEPTIKGRHQLHIKVQGQHIQGSPFSVAVKSPVEKLGTPILTLGGVKGPWGVAINQRGEVVVTESEGHRVSVFSWTGEKLLSFGKCGSVPGHFVFPREIAVDGEKNILVVDSWNQLLQKFTPECKHSSSVCITSSKHLQSSLPTGVAFNASNNKVYVGNTDNHHVQVLNSDLTFSGIIGKEGSGMGQFQSPHGIACDSTGQVYVADRDNHRVQVFTAEGSLLRMFGRRGQDRGELDLPVGVAIDTSDMVYVSEWGNHHVSVFTSEGQFVTSFGKVGKGPGELMNPCGLAVDNSGVVYVCDRDNNRVQCYN